MPPAAAPIEAPRPAAQARPDRATGRLVPPLLLGRRGSGRGGGLSRFSILRFGATLQRVAAPIYLACGTRPTTSSPWPSPPKEERETAWRSARCSPGVLAASGALAGVAGLLLFCFDPRQYHFYPICFFHQATGLLCPGCGVLRGMHQLLHGHLTSAFRFNPMLVASLPFLSWFGAKFALQTARRQPLSVGLRPAWLWLILAAVLVVSVLRNLPGAPFAMLRP